MTYQTTVVLNPETRRGRREVRERYELHRTLRSVCPPDTDTDEARLLYRVGLQGKPKQAPGWEHIPTPVVVRSPSLHPGREFTWPRHMVPLHEPRRARLDWWEGGVLRFEVLLYPVRRNSDGEHVLPRWAWRGYLARQMGKAGAAVLEADCEQVPDTPAKGAATLTTVRFCGLLAVGERETFRRALCGGIGRGKAWGLGLLTVQECK
ncbi:MAG: type I-E CRISPR-associated protein Cas6/Cse3/CasE [Bacteroidetes bacterium]|jgi:CRISPR system Cascade subunit CasE|nr:type I-E CRISPR-associated protein Cas6/Cse3/CasE [Bacteroidota bacterium]